MELECCPVRLGAGLIQIEWPDVENAVWQPECPWMYQLPEMACLDYLIQEQLQKLQAGWPAWRRMPLERK
jgi:hypothetical protein